MRRGEKFYGWYPLAKGVSNLYRYGEIQLAANGNYLNALAVEPDSRPARESLSALTNPVARKGHRYGGFNPMKESDINLFKAVMDGSFIAFGFENRNIRAKLFGVAESKKDAARLSAKTGRLLKKLHARELIAKVPRTRRWRVGVKGWPVLAAATRIFDVGWPQLFDDKAA